MVVWIRSAEPAIGLEGHAIPRDDWVHVCGLLAAAEEIARLKELTQSDAQARQQLLDTANAERTRARYQRAAGLGLRRGVRRGLAIAKQAETASPMFNNSAQQLADVVITVVKGMLLELPVNIRWELARERVQQLLGNASSATVSVHPDDLECAQSLLPKMGRGEIRLSFVADGSLSRGDLRVDCGDGLLRHELHSQLEAIRLVLINHFSRLPGPREVEGSR